MKSYLLVLGVLCASAQAESKLVACERSLDPQDVPTAAQVISEDQELRLFKKLPEVRQKVATIPQLKEFLVKLKPCKGVGSIKLQTYVNELERSAQATVDNDKQTAGGLPGQSDR
jgi:hypothetical protein